MACNAKASMRLRGVFEVAMNNMQQAEKPGAQEAETIRNAAVRAPLRNKARILVAEDDPAMLDSVATALELYGAEIVRATSGVEMLQLIAAGAAFDLVVTDVAMPWMSGIQVMLAARGAGRHMPVIVMTALRDERILGQVAALGSCARLLRKPFDLAELESTVTSLLFPA